MLRLHALGGLRLDNGGPQPLQRLRLALLAAVAVAGRKGISRDRLVALFWPESDDARARGALKQALHGVRRDLQQPDLFLGVDPLQLNPAVITSDVAEFEAALREGDLARAVEQYNGPFLAGFHVSNGEFDQWREAEQHRLALRYRQALEQLALGAERSGDLAGAVEWWRRLAAAEPLSSAVAISLMQALARAGDRTAAIRHAGVHAAVVKAELDALPEPKVMALAATFRAEHERAPAPPPPAVEPTASPAPGQPARAPLPNPLAPPPRWPRITLGAIGLAAIAGLALPQLLPVASGAVRVEVEGRMPASTDSLLRAGISDALLLRLPETPMAATWGRAAQFRAAVSVVGEGDSLLFRGTVTDRVRSTTWELDPTAAGVSAPGLAIEAIGERIAIAIAAARSPVMQRWAYKAALPHSWAGLKALEAALEGWAPPFNLRPVATSERLARAAAADSTSGSPLALGALVLAKHGLFKPAESLLVRLERPGVRIGIWDSGIAAVVRAWIAGDLAGSHRAGHRLLDSVPGSEWAVLPAYDALGLGYAGEALELLQQIDPAARPNSVSEVRNAGAPEWLSYWRHLVEIQAWYHLGRFDSMLVSARGTLARDPDDRIAIQSTIKALAGLGREAEVEQLCRQVLTRTLTTAACGQGILELRGRGHRVAARRIADMVLAALAATDTISSTNLRAREAELAVASGDWAGAGRVLDGFSWDELGAADLQTDWLMVQAFRGDSISVRRGIERLQGRLDVWDRAQLAALSGDRQRAVALVGEGFRSGFRRGFPMFLYPGLDALHGFPPFDRLVAPLESTDHLDAVRRVAAR